MIKLIGFCGYARSGKDTAAGVLIDRGWYRRAFADALKLDAMTALENSWDRAYDCDLPAGMDDMFHNPEAKERFRPFLVEYGRAMRNLEPKYWVHRLFANMLRGDDCDYSYVITDVRYRNEVDAIRAAGGKVIMVLRKGVGPANAEEERSFRDVDPDAVIENDGTVAELHAKVLAAVAGFDLTDTAAKA